MRKEYVIVSNLLWNVLTSTTVNHCCNRIWVKAEENDCVTIKLLAIDDWCVGLTNCKEKLITDNI